MNTMLTREQYEELVKHHTIGWGPHSKVNPLLEHDIALRAENIQLRDAIEVLQSSRGILLNTFTLWAAEYQQGKMAVRELPVLHAEVTRLKERLEEGYGFDQDGTRVEDPCIPDGIACRDETIRGLDERVTELQAENERLKRELQAYRVEDGFGGVWQRCNRPGGCGLQVVRPGKAQCNCEYDMLTESYYEQEIEALTAQLAAMMQELSFDDLPWTEAFSVKRDKNGHGMLSKKDIGILIRIARNRYRKAEQLRQQLAISEARTKQLEEASANAKTTKE